MSNKELANFIAETVRHRAGPPELSLAIALTDDAWKQVVKALRSDVSLPSEDSVTAANYHLNAPNGSLPTYSEIRCMAAEILRLSNSTRQSGDK